MFAARFFSLRFWASRFWPKVGAASAPAAADLGHHVSLTASTRTLAITASTRTHTLTASE